MLVINVQGKRLFGIGRYKQKTNIIKFRGRVGDEVMDATGVENYTFDNQQIKGNIF